MKFMGPLLFATVAAVGNALYAAGQKKAAVTDNSITFIALTAGIAVLLALSVAPFLGKVEYLNLLKSDGHWALVSGIGLFMTFLGFNLMYTNYGTSSYVLYAVLSIIATVVLVGVLFLGERMGAHRWAALLCAFLAVFLFSMGQGDA